MKSRFSCCLLLLFAANCFSQSSQQPQYLGAKPGLWINGINCKIGHLTQSCTPKTCDSLVIFPGDSIDFCTDVDVDLSTDTVYYMQWNFNGSSNYPNPVFDYTPSAMPVCYDPKWTVPGNYVVDVFYNGWLTAYPDRDCYAFGPSHWILHVTVMPGPNSVQDVQSSEGVSLLPNPAADEFSITLEEKSTLEIFSLPGGKVLSCSLEPGKSSVDISGLAPGIYCCKISGKAGKFSVQRLVVAR